MGNNMAHVEVGDKWKPPYIMECVRCKNFTMLLMSCIHKFGYKVFDNRELLRREYNRDGNYDVDLMTKINERVDNDIKCDYYIREQYED